MGEAADLTGELRRMLDGPRHLVREQVRRELSDARFVTPISELTLEEHRSRTTAHLLEVLRQPWAAMGFTEEQGGTGDPGGSLAAFETLAGADLSLFVKLGVQVGLFGAALANLGTATHHRHLPGVLDGSLPGCFAMTETGGGSDVAGLRTTATHDPATDDIVVHTPGPAARKDYLGNAARDGRAAVVFARLVVAGTDRGVHAVYVPIRDEHGTTLPGVTIEDCGPKIGLPGVDNGRLSFDRVRVPRANLLDRYGAVTGDGRYTSPIHNPDRRFFTMLGTLVRGRVSVGAGAGAVTRNALTVAVRYAHTRTQFDKPDDATPVRLMEYPTHQRRLLIPLARSYALAFAANALIEQVHRVQTRPDRPEHDVRALEESAASLKVAGTAHATATIQACREACGGAGYMWENRFGAWKADTDVFTTFEGDNTVLLQLVAKGLLTHYRDSFESMDTRDLIRFGAAQFAGAVIERAAGGTLIQRLIAGAPGRDADRALADRGGQLAYFEDREKHTVETLALRVRRRSQTRDGDLFGVLAAVQPHMLAAAWAHIDRMLLDAFAAATASATGPAAGLLGTVCDLFAYSTVETHARWFLEHGRISTGESRAITRRVDALCAELAPRSGTLVDAFAIPPSWIDCPLAPGPGPAGQASGWVPTV